MVVNDYGTDFVTPQCQMLEIDSRITLAITLRFLNRIPDRLINNNYKLLCYNYGLV